MVSVMFCSSDIYLLFWRAPVLQCAEIPLFASR